MNLKPERGRGVSLPDVQFGDISTDALADYMRSTMELTLAQMLEDEPPYISPMVQGKNKLVWSLALPFGWNKNGDNALWYRIPMDSIALDYVDGHRPGGEDAIEDDDYAEYILPLVKQLRALAKRIESAAKKPIARRAL